MKTHALIISIVIISFLISSCNTSRKITKDVVGIKLKELPCSGSKYMSDKDYYIANNSAKSKDLSVAREKAMLLAKQRVSSIISSHIKSTTDRYLNERGVSDKTNIEQKFENLTREVVNQQLSDIEIVCESQTVLPTGEYQSFIAIRVSKESIINDISDRINNNDKLQLDYDKYRYEKIFNEEMEKYQHHEL
jgi:predicted small secreted protein